jgi:Sulfotransferase family
VSDHDFIFVGGLHRSGTTLLARAIAKHEQVSGFRKTEALANEGQFLQSVYPIAREFGGTGRFGFDERSHMTEESPLATEASREQLLREWSEYWNLDKRVLVEKSPPNLLKLRFLQALFPEATFVVIMRHPIAVSFATQKWSKTSVESLLEHWLTCHEILLEDAPHIRRLMLVRYEDFVTDPAGIVGRIQQALGLAPSDAAPVARTGINDSYFGRWRARLQPWRGREHRELARRFEGRANRFGYSLIEPERDAQPAPEVRDLLGPPRGEAGARRRVAT